MSSELEHTRSGRTRSLSQWERHWQWIDSALLMLMIIGVVGIAVAVVLVLLGGAQ